MAVRFAFLCNLWSAEGRNQVEEGEEEEQQRGSSSCCLRGFFIWSPVNGMFWFRAGGSKNQKKKTTSEKRKRASDRANNKMGDTENVAYSQALRHAYFRLTYKCIYYGFFGGVNSNWIMVCVRYETTTTLSSWDSEHWNWFPANSKRFAQNNTTFSTLFSFRNGPSSASCTHAQSSCQREWRFAAQSAHALPRHLQTQPWSGVSIRTVVRNFRDILDSAF